MMKTIRAAVVAENGDVIHNTPIIVMTLDEYQEQLKINSQMVEVLKQIGERFDTTQRQIDLVNQKIDLLIKGLGVTV